MAPYGSGHQPPLTLTMYRVCYEIEDGTRREWDFATEHLAKVAKAVFLLRYPSARILTSTALYSATVPSERERYESDLHAWTTARQAEEQLLRDRPAGMTGIGAEPRVC